MNYVLAGRRNLRGGREIRIMNAQIFDLKHTRVSVSVCVQGVGQGYVHHEVPLIIIILNVVLIPFDDDILYTDNLTRLFYSHFHHQQ